MRYLTKFSFWTVFLATFFFYIASFLIVYFSGINNLILQSEDLLPTSTLPFSILREGNVNLNEYYDLFVENYPNPDTKTDTPYYLKKFDNNYYSAFPVLTPFLVLPLYIIPTFLNFDSSIIGISIMSRIGGAFISALSVGFFYLLLKKIKSQNGNGERKKRYLSNYQILILLLIYTFGTNMFSMNSQGLWQHGTSTLFLSLGLLFVLKKRVALAGLSFGLATVARPTNLLSLVLFSTYFLFRKKNLFLSYIFYSSIPVIVDLIFNILIFNNIFNTGYGSQIGGWTGKFPEGFFGLWISPSKGILIYSPVFIFIFYGIYKSFQNFILSRKVDCLDMSEWFVFVLTSLAIFLHTLILGRWHHWYGGYSWGYRMVSDIIPYLTFLLIPFITSRYFSNWYIRIFFYALTFWSIFTHFLGVLMFDGLWHIVFDKGGRNTSWLWSFKDNQIFFAVKRILFKVGLISSDPFSIVKNVEGK